ncbi:MAG TPA: peptide ABC transporter, partial [Corynebacterium sp.]|nr:peptide ABC transporter [Corynebacterium sp.]
MGLLTAVGVTLASCSPAPETPGEDPAEGSAPEILSTGEFGYQVNQSLTTTNAGSSRGVSVNAHLVAGRLYPAVYVPGPAGQMIPNTDLVTAQSLPGPQRQVVYTLNEEATFSDGTPVTCVDFLLTQTAGQMADLFDSHMPLLNQIESMDCEPGDREFTTVYQPGEGGRWRQVFGPGTVLPA